jgi:hypothetical protein
MESLKYSRSKKVDNSDCLTIFAAIYIVVWFPLAQLLSRSTVQNSEVNNV